MDLRQIFSPERDVFLKKIKQAVLSGNVSGEAESYREFVEEWQASAELGVSHTVSVLGDNYRDFSVFNNVSNFTKYKLAYLDDFVIKRENALSELGCAIFYLDPNLSTFRAAGNKEMLDELRGKGVRHGTCFSERNVGKFVGNMAKNFPGRTLCRVGEENYLDTFTQYVCFARYEEEALRDFTGANVIFVPKNKYTIFMRTQVTFLMDAMDMTNMVNYPFMERQHQLLQATAYDSEKMMLLLNRDGDTVFSSRLFEQEFGKMAAPVKFENISSFMPDLSFATKLLADGREAIGKELLLTDKQGISHFYQIQFSPVRVGKEAIGVMCLFLRTDQKKKQMSKVTGQEIRYTFDSIIGESKAIREMKSLAKQIAPLGSNVLIQGESGTGKELLAQSIHSASAKANGPFIPVNCAAVPNDLISSELFGYESGAFTGAVKGGYAGKFEQANGGTIFLDEVSEMPMSMQSALLRVLEDNVITRLGGSRYIHIDTRVIAATNRDLWTCVQKCTFRADLYFRLNIVKFTIPTIRERPDDIEILTEHMIRRLVDRGICGPVSFGPELLELFRSYTWPGNVRELRNVVERCLTATSDKVITPGNIPFDVLTLLMSKGDTDPVAFSALAGEGAVQEGSSSFRDMDRKRLEALMLKYNGNKSKVAKELGLARGTVYKKLREFGMAD